MGRRVRALALSLGITGWLATPALLAPSLAQPAPDIRPFQSAHVVSQRTLAGLNDAPITTSDGEIVPPDAARYSLTLGGQHVEVIAAGGSTYLRSALFGDPNQWYLGGSGAQAGDNPLGLLGLVQSLSAPRSLGDETLDGLAVEHIQGEIDPAAAGQFAGGPGSLIGPGPASQSASSSGVVIGFGSAGVPGGGPNVVIGAGSAGQFTVAAPADPPPPGAPPGAPGSGLGAGPAPLTLLAPQVERATLDVWIARDTRYVVQEALSLEFGAGSVPLPGDGGAAPPSAGVVVQPPAGAGGLTLTPPPGAPPPAVQGLAGPVALPPPGAQPGGGVAAFALPLKQTVLLRFSNFDQPVSITPPADPQPFPAPR